MAVEAVESELAHISAEAGIEESNPLLHAKENGEMNHGEELNEPIKFGSHGTDETSKREAVNVREANLPKDAVDEWPEPKIHYFYFMKYRPFDDQKLKAKLDQADKELQKLNQARFQITEKLRAKRAERAQVISHVRTLSVETRQFRTIMDEKRKEMEPLQQALGKLRNSNASGRDRGYGICSSEEELNDIIKSLNYRMAHESIPLTEEKQILREIKQLEGTRDKVIANAAVRAKIQDSLGEKEVIQDQVKLIGGDLDGVRKEQQVVKAKLKLLDDEKEAIEKQINALQDELMVVAEKKDKAFEKIQELRKQRDEGNACFYQNRTLLIKARELAAKKEIEALKELADIEVDKFVSLWTSMKAVRDDYERRILPSLDARQFSRDGRMRNPGEKPLVVLEVAPPPSQPEIITKPNVKQKKDEPVSVPQTDNTSSVEKAPKEKNNKQQKEAKDKESNLKESKVEEAEEVFGLVDPSPPPKKNEVDVEKLREMKREEEIAKAKQAVERKKKLAEKAAAKAAIKAQKEAEKKLKDREKKAKKKAAAASGSVELEEASEISKEEEVAEPELAEESVEVAPSVPSKNKERRKESNIRSRTTRSKGGPDSLPKAILKRKKSTNYWNYAAPAAAAFLVVLLLLAAGCYYYYI